MNSSGMCRGLLVTIRAMCRCARSGLRRTVVWAGLVLLTASQGVAMEAVNDTDSGELLLYSLGWTRWEGSQPRGGTLHYANHQGSFLELTFRGTAVQLWHKVGPDCGIARITVNGQPAATAELDTYSPEVDWNRRTLLADLSPHVLDDGSILFTRWEYQDKSVFPIQSLWTINPDGTRLNLVYGNTITTPNTIWQARPIPGTRKLLCTLAPHHGNPVGAIGILDRHLGAENPRALRNLTPEIPYEATTDPNWRPGDREFPWSYRDPYPLDRDLFLVSHGCQQLQRYRLFLLDDRGDKLLLHEDAQLSCFNAIPLVPRRLPGHLPSHEPTGSDYGTFLLADVYQGLSGVPRGSVQRLRVMSTQPKPMNNRGARAYYHGHDIVEVLT